jgi:hypothetical protein
MLIGSCCLYSGGAGDKARFAIFKTFDVLSDMVAFTQSKQVLHPLALSLVLVGLQQFLSKSSLQLQRFACSAPEQC